MRKSKRFLLISVAFGALLSLMAAGAALAAPITLTATLKGGAAENPPGDPDGSGTATITIAPDTRQVCWNITVTNIAAATASHIHSGGAGTNGGVVIPLDVDGFTGSTSGCVAAPAAADLNAIIANPANFYVNVHTADFPAGAVRGQLAAASPNTAFARPPGSPLLPLGLAFVLIGIAGALRQARTRV